MARILICTTGAIDCAISRPYVTITYAERGRLYRLAIYAYLCARMAYGRDIAQSIARAVLKLRPVIREQ
jgi:hypothetical protein